MAVLADNPVPRRLGHERGATGSSSLLTPLSASASGLVLLLTFGLTILVDLTVAIGVGVTLASLLFMARMSEGATITSSEDLEEADDASQRDRLPAGVEVFAINGPFFFGVAQTLLEAFKRVGASPETIILRLERVPFLDASGAIAVHELLVEAERAGIRIILCGVRRNLLRTLRPLVRGAWGQAALRARL